jgi:hypothetical protein
MTIGFAVVVASIDFRVALYVCVKMKGGRAKKGGTGQDRQTDSEDSRDGTCWGVSLSFSFSLVFVFVLVLVLKGKPQKKKKQQQPHIITWIVRLCSIIFFLREGRDTFSINSYPKYCVNWRR